jgi:hypothetical protein
VNVLIGEHFYAFATIVTSPSAATAHRQGAAAGQEANAGAADQNGGNGVPEEVTKLLNADPPSWPWILAAFGILAVGITVSYVTWRLVKPTDFTPSSNYAVYVGLFVMALAIQKPALPPQRLADRWPYGQPGQLIALLRDAPSGPRSVWRTTALNGATQTVSTSGSRPRAWTLRAGFYVLISRPCGCMLS